MANVDNLNFKVILDDKQFNHQIEKDISAAKNLNIQLSSLLDVKAKVSRQMKVSVETKDAVNSLEQLNAKFAELERSDWSKIGKKLNVTPQVEQALIQLRKLEEEIEVIQSLRQESGGDMSLALELKRAQEEANRLVATIAELRKTEKAVNAPSQFQSHIRSLTEQSLEYQRLVEYMRAEEKAAEKVAKEKAKEEKERSKNAAAIEKERKAMSDGIFKEHIASLTATNPQLKQMAAYYREIEKETAKNAKAAQGAAVYQKRLNDQFKVTSRLGNEVKNALIGIFSIHGASQLLSSLVRVTGEFELQKTTLAAMLGDLNAAEGVITRIQGLAVESPFQFKELTTYAKQLSAFSVPAQELYDTTKMLADISAGLGVGMDRIVLAYGQVRSAAFLRGQEVRQFTEAGIPILDELAKQFTELEGRAVSTGEVFDKISARLVPFEMVAKVFKDMTSEGGKFYNMQEVQAETLRGKISNLKDAYEVMLNEIGSGQSEKLKGAVDWARRLMQNYKEIGGQIIDLIKLFGSYKVAVGLLSISDTIAKYGGLAKAIQQTTIAQKVLNSALLTNPYIAVATAISAVVIALHRKANTLTIAERAQSAYNQRMRDASREESRRRSEILGLVDVVNDETQATIEREAALLSLKESYPKIFEQYDIESLKLSDILRIKRQIAEEDAKTRRVSALGSIAAQRSRYSSLVNRGAGQSYKDEAFAMLQELEKGYLSDYIIPELTAGLKDIGDEDLQKLKDEIYRKAQYDIRGLEKFDGIPTTQDFYEEYMKAIQSELSRRKNVKLTDGWRKTVQDTLTGMGLNKGTSFGLWAEDTTQSTEYVDDMIKRYKELGEQIKNVSSFDPDQTERLKQNKEAIEAIAKALNIDIKNLAANDSDTWESKEEKRLKRLIETLRKLQDQYDELKSLGVSDDAIKSLFKGWYPELGGDFFNNMDFLSRAKTAVEELRKYNPGAADQALVNLGGDKYTQYVDKLKEQQKAYKESAKAAGEYFNMLRKWSSEDFNLNGEGIALDVSKIASDLSEKMNEIDLRARKAKEVFGQIDVDSEEEVAKVKEIFVKEFGADAWEEFWQSYKEKSEDAITDLTNKQKEYEKKLAQERVNDLASKYVKESYFEGNIDLSELSDKNFFQLRELRKKLQNILNQEPLQISVELSNDLAANGVDVSSLSGINLDEVFKNMEGLGKPISEADQELLRLIQSIQKAGLSTEDFGKIIKKVIGGDLKNLTKEEAEELMSMVQSYMGEIQKLITSISEFAEAIGSEKLQGAMNGIVESMNILGSVADKLAKGDWIGAIISGVTSLASKVMEAVSAEYALNDAIAETRNEMLLLNSQKAINEGVESIFGTDDYKKFQNAYDEVVKAHATAIKDLEKQNQTFWGRSKDNWGVGGVAGSLAAGAGLGAAIGSIFPVIGTAIGAGVGALIGMVVGLVGNAATTANDYATSLQQMADEIGAELIDAETGTFNIETLKSIKKTYSDLDKEYIQMIDKLIANAEVYENAITEMASFMTDIFGQCADDMADSFINSFKESGQAALEYGDIMSNLASDIAKSIIKSTILQNVFSEEDARNAAISLAKGDAGGALAVVEDAMQAAQDLTPYIQEFLESLKPYFDMGDMESQNLGDGIKGITEDTANLLASYLNAIRADVSYARTIWERMDATTQQIAAMLVNFSVPNLMEYQAQIAANTYNTAMHTQSIMEDLRSMMTSDGGATALRVYS